MQWYIAQTFIALLFVNLILLKIKNWVILTLSYQENRKNNKPTTLDSHLSSRWICNEFKGKNMFCYSVRTQKSVGLFFKKSAALASGAARNANHFRTISGPAAGAAHRRLRTISLSQMRVWNMMKIYLINTVNLYNTYRLNVTSSQIPFFRFYTF